MTLTIDLTPELETKLRQAAVQQGLDVKDYVLRLLQERLHAAHPQEPHHLSETEAHLLQQINQGLPQETWQDYHQLILKRQAETLTPEEQTRLIVISDQLEALNVQRIEYLADLARLRQLSLSTLLEQLAPQPMSESSQFGSISHQG